MRLPHGRPTTQEGRGVTVDLSHRRHNPVMQVPSLKQSFGPKMGKLVTLGGKELRGGLAEGDSPHAVESRTMRLSGRTNWLR